jgi:DNA-binding beta-propeller fold protein YncE
MLKKGEKTTYYISNVGTCSLSMIDGYNFSRIKEIKIDSRPQKIVVDDRNNVFIACDRNDRITCIPNSKRVNQTWDIPNNGNLEVDSIAQKIYACNAEEIGIYNLETGEMIYNIKGFSVASCIKLDKKKKRLFVLDVLEKVIKVFSTESYKLIRAYKNVGMAPNDFIIGTEEQYLFVANKGLNRKKYSGNISIVDIDNGSISYIDMENDSVITEVVQHKIHLFAANNGLHQIEVIDLLSKRCIHKIKTTLPYVQRLKILPGSDTLLVISLDENGKGALDRIDTNNNIIVDTYFLEEKSFPYDIGIVIQRESKVKKTPYYVLASENRGNKEDNWEQEERKNVENEWEREERGLTGNVGDSEKRWYNENQLHKDLKRNKEYRWNSGNRWNKENGLNILAKEVISIYQEKVIFPEIKYEVNTYEMDIINVEEVVFRKCELVSESLHRQIIKNRKEYSILQYDFYIPYDISYKEKQDKTCAFKGKIEGSQKATLFLPAITEQLGVEFVVNTFARLISPPIIDGNIVRFEVSALISTIAVIDKTVFISFDEGCLE